MSQFVNLHQHSVYSIRDSIARIDDLIARAVELKHPAIALTDHGTLSGVLEFYHVARDNDIKPILGCEVYMATRGRTQKEKGIDKYYHLTLLAMNNVGWKNLTALVTESYDPANFYHKPRIDRELLRKHNEGLICLSGCVGGNLANTIMKDLKITFEDEEGNTTMPEEECKAEDWDRNSVDIRPECSCSTCQEETGNLPETFVEVVEWHKNVFGDRYYLEVQNHYMNVDEHINEVIYFLADKYNIKTIATGDTHFVNHDDEKAHDIMLAIQGNFSIHDTEKMQKRKYSGNGYELLSDTQMFDRFPGHKESVTNTLEVMERCNVDFHLGDFKLPHAVDIKEEDEVFRTAVMKGLENRFGKNLSVEVLERANEEMETIIQMTFPSYFLIVADYISWARKNNILVGPGRGSAAGSIVSYALGITNVNPLEYDLSFSRFLNRGRASIPQIDFPEFPMAEWKFKQQQNKGLAV